MRKSFGSQSWLYPMPVLIIATYNQDGSPNVMNAAWGGIYDTNKLAVCIDPSHKTAENIMRNKAFTVSIADAAHIAECDFVGIVSGTKNPDKFTKANFTEIKSEFVDAPLIAELPMTLECNVISYNEQSGCTVAEIINISADEKILDENGRINPAKFTPISYDPVNHTYLKIGEIAGTAFHDGKKLK